MLTQYLFYLLLGLTTTLGFLTLFFWFHYNKFVRRRNQVKTDLSDIQIQIRRKIDLIESLSAVVKQYATHEKDTLVQTSQARSQLDNSKSTQDVAKADNMLTQTLRSLFSVVEAYPKLQANSQYKRLDKELQNTENQIAEYRETYNKAVQRYNNGIQTFPCLLPATIFQFTPEPLFSDNLEKNA